MSSPSLAVLHLSTYLPTWHKRRECHARDMHMTEGYGPPNGQRVRDGVCDGENSRPGENAQLASYLRAAWRHLASKTLPRRWAGSRWTPTPPPPLGVGIPPLPGTACGAWQGHPLGGGRRFPCRLSATTPAPGGNPCSQKRAQFLFGRLAPAPSVGRLPACHECEPLAVRTPACGFEWRAIPLA